jgi:nuclear transport factor 2 (NTF2) superfamily protein
MSRLPIPPFTEEMAAHKVRAAEDARNSRERSTWISLSRDARAQSVEERMMRSESAL